MSSQFPFETMPSTSQPVLEWVFDNLKLIAAGVGVVLFVVAAVSAYRSWHESFIRQTRNELSRLASQADIPAMEAFAQAAPAEVRTLALLEVARVATAKGAHDRGAWAYGLLLQDGPADVRPLAALGKAGSLLKQNKAAEAFDVLAAAKGQAPEAMRPLLLRQAAIAAEQAGKKAEALAIYQELSAKASPAEQEFLGARMAALKAG